MTRTRLIAAAVAMGIIALVPQPSPAGPSGKAYDAVYEMTTSEGTATQRKISDGAGRLRTELTSARGTSITIEDQQMQVRYTVVPDKKVVLMGSLSVRKKKLASMDAFTDEEARSMGLQPLGSKLVEGHPCHGYRFASPQTENDTWIGDDIGVMVASDSTAPMTGQISVRLKSFSPYVPDPALFQVPDGYKVVNMPVPGAGGMFAGAAQYAQNAQSRTGGR